MLGALRSLMSRGLENAGCMKAIVVKIARAVAQTPLLLSCHLLFTTMACMSIARFQSVQF